MGIGSKIKATTGFQTVGYEHDELVSIFKLVLKSDEKHLEFVTKRLRGAKDVFSKGGHVQHVYKDQKFRLYHDNRRQIIEPPGFKGHNLSNTLLDSKPIITGPQVLQMRSLSRFPFTLSFNKQTSIRSGTTYKSYLDVGVRNFIKSYVAKQPLFGLRGDEFKSYKELLAFINEFDSTKLKNFNVKISKQSISNLKHRKLIWRPVPSTSETESWVRYIQCRLPHFKGCDFLRVTNYLTK